MKWNVYRYDINDRRIEVFNIFDHYSFNRDVMADLETYRNKDEFDKALKSHLMYYFWSKSEWEVLICPWTDNKEGRDRKIDVYEQVMLNWDVFADYCWTH